MYKRDPMLQDIHEIRRKMWEESKHDPHALIENIKNEAKAFVEKYGYRFRSRDDGERGREGERGGQSLATLPRHRRLDSVKRHHQWQRRLDRERFFDQVFAAEKGIGQRA